jgi:hypothetical protein
MALVFQRGFVIPLWVVALCAVVVAPPWPLLASFTTLLVIAVMGSMTTGSVRWLGTFRRPVAVSGGGRTGAPGRTHCDPPQRTLLTRGVDTVRGADSREIAPCIVIRAHWNQGCC